MRTGRPKQVLVLSEEERERLESLARRARSQPALARRARVVLGCAEGLDNKTVAKKSRCSLGMVGKWRSRFLQTRLEGLYDEPRPGAPRKVTDEQIEKIIIQTLETTPRGQTHWSTRELAKVTGFSRMTISRVWRAFGMQPHRTETFKLSPDPLLIEKVRDMVGLYMDPPEHAVVFCVDEKSQIQALDRTQPMLPMRPGQLERRTHDYKRHGITSLFAALELKTSRVIGQLHRRHRSQEFRRFWTPLKRTFPQISMFLLCWTPMAHTRPTSSGNGLQKGRAFTCTSHSPTAPGSTWSSAGSPKSPTNASAAAYFAACENGRRLSGNTSTFTTKIPSHSSGRELQTRYSPASPVSMLAAIDVQQHARQGTSFSAPPVRPTPPTFLHQPRPLQRLLYLGVAQIDALFLVQLLVELPHAQIEVLLLIHP